MDNKSKELVFNGAFKYKGETYHLYIDDRCKKYFYKVVDGKLDYITLEEYIGINKDIFSIHNVLNKKCHILPEPLIKIKNKLVPYLLVGSLLFSLTGCASGKEKTKEGLSDIGIEIEDVSDQNDYYLITKIDDSDKKNYGGVDYSELKEIHFSKKYTPAEFGKYIGKENVSFDDLREVTKGNENIPEEIKELILSGIENLEEQDFNINYAVLYYNLKRMNVHYVYSSETFGNSGLFYYTTSEVRINNNIKNGMSNYEKKVILHEILGHGSTSAYNEEDQVLCNLTNLYLEIDESGKDSGFSIFGASLDEGMADIISSISLGRPLQQDEYGYPTFMYAISLFCSTLDISIEEFANNGINYLIDKMKEKGIANPYQLIARIDNTFTLIRNNMNEIIENTDLFTDYIEEMHNLGVSKEKLDKDANSYKKYVVPMRTNISSYEPNECNSLTWGSGANSGEILNLDYINNYIASLEELSSHKTK